MTGWWVDQREESADYELNARYDYVREAYGASASDARYEAECERYFQEWEAYGPFRPAEPLGDEVPW